MESPVGGKREVCQGLIAVEGVAGGQDPIDQEGALLSKRCVSSLAQQTPHPHHLGWIQGAIVMQGVDQVSLANVFGQHRHSLPSAGGGGVGGGNEEHVVCSDEQRPACPSPHLSTPPPFPTSSSPPSSSIR